ncbi:hypothetical protein GCM10023149_30950 [Mucilaginibacter gynuensis]|uniref:Uncharacterized protein n=1 Tax=Mucilaginibacter gynuensis TaxID=1302236 RepID=A0ABP8GN89_9SPHI
MRSQVFNITFQHKGKACEYIVDKMFFDYETLKKTFYRITAKTGNRDVEKIGGTWTNCGGKPLPADILQKVGTAIDEAEANGLPFNGYKSGVM